MAADPGRSAFATIGQVVAHMPAQRILRWDRKTGYGIYQRELERSGDEAQAFRAAGQFYKVIGWLFTIGALLFVAVGLVAGLAQ
jgi:hypothetical protein